MTTFRRAEQLRQIAEAARESLNRNTGPHRDQSPISTRNAAEAKTTNAESERIESVPRDHSVAALCAMIPIVGSVRSRLENPDRPSAVAQQKPESLYEQEVRCFGKYWADVYAARRARGENA